MSGGSATSIAVGVCVSGEQPCTLSQDQAIHRLATGDGNPDAVNEPDVVITVAPAYWLDVLRIDPDPEARTDEVPFDRTDAISVLTHELGHGFGMAGYRSLTTGLQAIDYLSVYDDLVVIRDEWTFDGPQTVADIGTIPLTQTTSTQNVYHYGDPSAPSPFDAGLMNGIVFDFGVRYRVGRVDALIVADLGIPIRRLPD